MIRDFLGVAPGCFHAKLLSTQGSRRWDTVTEDVKLLHPEDEQNLIAQGLLKISGGKRSISENNRRHLLW